MNGAARGLKSLAEQAWLPIVLVIVWWFASDWWWSTTTDSKKAFLPPLSRIWDAFIEEAQSGDLGVNFVASMRNIALGLLVGVVVGIAIGTVVGRSRAARAILNPYLQFARSVPQVALVPIIIGAFGITWVPKIWAIAIACIWPILLNTVDGIRAIDPAVRDMTKAYRLTSGHELFRVVLPAALPQIMAGIRVSLGVAVVVMVVSEIYGSTEGLGYFINYEKGLYRGPETWMATILVGLIGYGLSLAFLVVEKFTLRWYHESAK